MKQSIIRFTYQVSFVLILSLAVQSAVFATHLTDIDGHDNQAAIEFLEENDVIDGNPDGTYLPDTGINRAEILKVLFEVSGDFAEEPTEDCFPDVPKDEWFAKYVCTGEELGYLDGYPDGYFRPGNEVNKVEALKLMAGFLDWDLGSASDEPLFDDTDESAWYAPYLRYAKQLELIEETGDNYEPSESMLRGPVAETVFRTEVVVALEDEAYDVSRLDEFYALYEDETGGGDDDDVVVDTGLTEDQIQEGIDLILWVANNEIEIASFLGTDGKPQMAVPNIYFDYTSTTFEIDAGTTGSDIDSLQVLLYDWTVDGWVYAYDSAAATSYFDGVALDDFGSHYTLNVDQVLIDDFTLNTLDTIDVGKGFLVQINTIDGLAYLLNPDLVNPEDQTWEYEVSDSPLSANNIAQEKDGILMSSDDCNCVGVTIDLEARFLEGIKSLMTKAGKDPTKAKDPSDSIWGSYAVLDYNKEQDFREYKKILKCGESSSSYIKIGDDGTNLTLQHRNTNNSSTKYILFFKVYTRCGDMWDDTFGSDIWECYCSFSFGLYDLDDVYDNYPFQPHPLDDIVDGSDNYRDCSVNLDDQFEVMLKAIEDKLNKKFEFEDKTYY